MAGTANAAGPWCQSVQVVKPSTYSFSVSDKLKMEINAKAALRRFPIRLRVQVGQSCGHQLQLRLECAVPSS